MIRTRKIILQAISAFATSAQHLLRDKSGKIETDPGYVWPELLAGFLLVLGFAVAISTSVLVNYVMITLAGLAFGRAIARYDQGIRLTAPIITLGFFAGFLLGAFGTNLRVVIGLFLLGGLVSYFVHKQKWFGSLEV